MRIMLCASPWWSQRTETAKSAQWGLPILKLLRTWAAQPCSLAIPTHDNVDQDLDARVFLLLTNLNFAKGDLYLWKHLNTGRRNRERSLIPEKYYPRAMKLSVAKPSWTNAMGEVKRGKTVVLDLSAVKNNPEAAAMFRRIAERMEG